MKRRKIIALCGEKGHGKNAAADVLLDRGWVEVKFAGCLKAMLNTMFGYTGFSDEDCQRLIEGDMKVTPITVMNDATPRKLMQTLGTEWGRDLISHSLWVDLTLMHIQNHHPNDNIIITDCRFPNEVVAAKSWGARVVRIERPMGGITRDLHPSEAQVRSLDVHSVIKNDGTIQQLQEKLLFEATE